MLQTNVPARAGDSIGIPRKEFIALIAALMALNALAIDIMLPAMQQIGAALDVADENSRQLVISAYVIGFGGAQLVFGPLSDRFGRRAPLIVGLVIYVVAAVAAVFAPSFLTLLALRFVQGLGAAGTRVIATSLVRDMFGGRRMAEVMSLVMMVFMIVPVLAPGAGQVIMIFGDWRLIFLVMGVVALAITVWTFVRLPETLAAQNRRALTFAAVSEGFRIVVTNRAGILYTLASMCMIAAVFGFINSAQQIYVGVYDIEAWFPALFALIAAFMAASSFLNSRLVGRLGMRTLSHAALLGFLFISASWFGLSLLIELPLVTFVVLLAAAMCLFGLATPNFNALAMEPLGHVAGTASAVIGFLQTVGGGLVGALIGLSFDGSVTPLAAGYCGVALAALIFVLIAEKGRLFRPQNPAV